MNTISDNLLAAFMEGKTSAADTLKIWEAAKKDRELREIIKISYEMNAEENIVEKEILPWHTLAARTNENKCAVLCELYILSLHGIYKSIEDWEKQASRQGWLKEGGTPIHNIGRLLEQECFSISRTFHNTTDDLKKALKVGNVIVVVDGKELTRDIEKLNQAHIEDDLLGPNPNHAIVVTEIKEDMISYYDPASKKIQTLSLSQFEDAWEDSSRYMVIVSKKDYQNYHPHPIDLSDVTLSDELMDLKEAIAENAHEVWAQGRKAQGWSYGPERNDDLKTTPDMVPYSDLAEEEKYYDREMAMNTIKLLKKLGYKIIKE